MDLDKLTNTQLYSLIRNDQMEPSVRKLANEEFNRRNLSTVSIEEIINNYEIQNRPGEEPGLTIEHKVLLLILPILFTFGLFAFSYFEMHKQKKRKEALLFCGLGYALWSAGIILFAYTAGRPK